MKNFTRKYRQIIIGVVVGGIAIYSLSLVIVDKKLNNLKNELEVNLNLSAKNINTMASTIAKGESNPIASRTVTDCTVLEQTQFDNRLGKLDEGLSRAELNELDTLFSRCAPVPVIKRSAMVVQLESEVSVLKTLIEQRKLLGDYSSYDDKLKTMSELLAIEIKTTELSFALVNLQYEIIKQLISGLEVNSAPANELKSQGQIIRTELNRLINEATSLREGIK